MRYSEEEFLMLSGIQHFAFCRRQWALIHIEQLWADNVQTVEGNILHERVHDEFSVEKRVDSIVSRGMRVFSQTLGVTGVCDVVEFRTSPGGIPLAGRTDLWQPVPIEYKRGKPKEHQADELQLCAQAICLEQMLVCQIPFGYLYYARTRHRNKVLFTDCLRERVEVMLSEMHDLFRRGHTPKTKPKKSCSGCSLADLCIPKLSKSLSATDYIHKHIMEDGL